MINLSVSKFLYPLSKIPLELEKYCGCRIQLSFFDPKHFLNLNHTELQRIISSEGIKVGSIHAPTIDIFQEDSFLRMLSIIREHYEVDCVTLHPGAGSPIEALKKHEQNESRINDIGLYLAYENFERSKKSRKWVYSAEGILKLPFSCCGLTYDTSHVPGSRNIVEDIENTYAKLAIMHLSNIASISPPKTHRPIGDGIHNLDEVIDFLRRRDYPGEIVLEYGPAYEKELLSDYRRITNMLIESLPLRS